MQLAGVDFTSNPRRGKPITVALGAPEGDGAHLERIDTHDGFESFARWLRTPGPWLAAFDFPFGLPRALVRHLGWPEAWAPLMRRYAATPRVELRDAFRAWCASRPAGDKFAHRACDETSGASPSMKWVNPPVAWMMHAGVPLLLDAGVDIPRLHRGDPGRVALEGYPGLVARGFVGRRSYKSDAIGRWTPERLGARAEIVDALARGAGRFGVRVAMSADMRESLIADGSADRLDAVLCLVQAAWAAGRDGFGLPPVVDPLEGWIVGALPRSQAVAAGTETMPTTTPETSIKRP